MEQLTLEGSAFSPEQLAGKLKSVLKPGLEKKIQYFHFLILKFQLKKNLLVQCHPSIDPNKIAITFHTKIITKIKSCQMARTPNH